MKVADFNVIIQHTHTNMLRNFRINFNKTMNLSANMEQLLRPQLFLLSGGLTLFQNTAMIYFPRSKYGPSCSFSACGWLKAGPSRLTYYRLQLQL